MKCTRLGRVVLTFALLIAMLAVPHTSVAQQSKNLFFIERNKNANIVQYDAKLAADGLFDAKEPAIAYWIMKAENGRREELNRIERELAYGFSTRVDESRRIVWLNLVAYKSQPIRLTLDNGAVRPEAHIAGRKAYLTKIYVKATDAVMPRVEYIEIFGVDAKTGKALYEKKTP